MPLGRTPITWNMTVRDALLNVINEDMAELFSRVEALELGVLSGVAIATEEEAITGVDNTKAMTPLRTRQAFNEYVSLGINADTLDGDHSTAFRRKDENINLSQGQIVDFADEVGDKIQLHGTQYGIAINANELTLYVPSTSEIAVRDSAYNGQKLGEMIHTGNIDSKGVAMKLSMTASTPGDFLIKKYWTGGSFLNLPNSYYLLVAEFYVPWTGALRYLFVFKNSYSSGANEAYVKINETEYGPYVIPYGGPNTNVYIDHSSTGSVSIYMKGTFNYCLPLAIELYTGNVDIVQQLLTRYMDNYLNHTNI